MPCLLTLPALAWGLLLGAVAGISSTTGGPDPGPMPTIGDTAAVLAELNSLTIPGPAQ